MYNCDFGDDNDGDDDDGDDDDVDTPDKRIMNLSHIVETFHITEDERQFVEMFDRKKQNISIQIFGRIVIVQATISG